MEIDTKAISPVVAVILMVAITVLLSAAVGTFAFSIGSTTEDTTATSNAVRIDQTSPGNYTVTLISTPEQNVSVDVGGDTVQLTKAGDKAKVSLSQNDNIVVTSGDTVLASKTETESTGLTSTVSKPTSGSSGPSVSAPSGGLTNSYEFENKNNGELTDTTNSQTGTINGDPQLVSGVTGNAYQFDGTDDYISFGTDDGEDKYTISVWVKTTATDGTIYHRGNSGVCDYNPRISISDITEDGCGGANQFTYSGSFADGDWHHVALTRDNSELKVYIDGTLDSTYTMSGGITDRKLYVGATVGFNGPKQYFDGTIDELREYNKPLSATEIQQLYNADKP